MLPVLLGSSQHSQHNDLKVQGAGCAGSQATGATGVKLSPPSEGRRALSLPLGSWRPRVGLRCGLLLRALSLQQARLSGEAACGVVGSECRPVFCRVEGGFRVVHGSAVRSCTTMHTAVATDIAGTALFGMLPPFFTSPLGMCWSSGSFSMLHSLQILRLIYKALESL